jgi:hypothetical protein
MLVTICVAAMSVGSAHAAEVDELQHIKNEMQQLKVSYEARMQALERRLDEMQRSPATASAVGTDALPPPVATQASSAAFNPAISLILYGTYAHLSRDPATYRLAGFIPSGGDAGPGARSFSLGESELGLAASIDPTFSGHLTMSITGDDKISVEEAVFERRGVFEGATIKGGRFLSSIGYLNSQHAHAWDFVDAPLAYQAFLGGQFKADGLHLHWLAPTETFVELGAEAGAGNTFPGAPGSRNGAGSVAMFAHVGDDIGESGSWRAGASLLHTRATDRGFDDTNAAGATVTNSFAGHNNTAIVDGIFKWAPGGNATRTHLKLQGEYFRRMEDGTMAFDITGANMRADYRSTQSGWYAQAVYQFMPMWRVGVRYDQLSSGTAKPSRDTLMIDYSLSEFSRFRLQFAADRSNPASTDHQIFLQYIMSLGAHGAHAF